MFSKAHQLFPSSSTLILSLSSHRIYLKLILELSCHLRLGLRNGLLPSGFPINTLYAFLFFTICTTCPTISFSKCVYMGENISLNEFYDFCFKCFLISWIYVQDYLFEKIVTSDRLLYFKNIHSDFYINENFHCHVFIAVPGSGYDRWIAWCIDSHDLFMVCHAKYIMNWKFDCTLYKFWHSWFHGLHFLKKSEVLEDGGWPQQVRLLSVK